MLPDCHRDAGHNGIKKKLAGGPMHNANIEWHHQDSGERGQDGRLGRSPALRAQVALSTALAAEFTSEAAPRTVLHAPTISEAPTTTSITILPVTTLSPC